MRISHIEQISLAHSHSLLVCRAATFTLYGVRRTDLSVETGLPTPSWTIEPIGTADGHTTYRERVVNSVYIEYTVNGDPTQTASGTTVTAPPVSMRTYTTDPVTVDGEECSISCSEDD